MGHKKTEYYIHFYGLLQAGNNQDFIIQNKS